VINKIGEILDLSTETICNNLSTELFLHPYNLKSEMLLNLYFHLKEYYNFKVCQSEIEAGAFMSIEKICLYIENHAASG